MPSEEKKYQLSELPYAYNALEPYIDEETMHLHHDKHHAAYTEKFNAALEKHPELFEKPLGELFKNLDEIPKDVRAAVKNQGGGYLNHKMFWEILAPASAKATAGKPANESGHVGEELMSAIERDFDSFEAFRQQLNNSAMEQFGSGWAWLVKDKEGKLKVYPLPNQDSPLSKGDQPLLAIDLWEHAYYLKYQNRRAEYVENIWSVINWDKVEELYKK